MNSIPELAESLRAFSEARDWDQFHTPKNLACALCVESAELLEQFQWSKAEDAAPVTGEVRQAVELELADVFIYLVRLADILNVDLLSAAERKLSINAQKYPPDLSRGSSKKYTEL